MKQILKLLMVSFSVVSCKDNKTRGEGERRINESEITIYSNKDVSDLKVGDFIYGDYTQKSIDDHKGFFDDDYSIFIKDILYGLDRIDCQTAFPEQSQCYQITNKDFEFNYTMTGSFLGSCPKFVIFCAPKSVESDLKTFKYSVKSDSEIW